LFEKTKDIHALVVDIFICRACSVLLNARAYQLLETTDEVDLQKTDLYMIRDESRHDLIRAIDTEEQLLGYMYDHVRRDWSIRTFCDFGAGRGLTAMAAARRFGRAVACELDTRPIEAVQNVIGPIDNFEAGDLPAKIDVLFMWHALEHLPYPLEFWRSRKKLLADDCVIFLQVPLYRPPKEVVDVHFAFHNNESLTRMFRRLGVEPIEIGYDVENAFVSFLGERVS
jgi:hypothetical protein